MYALDSSRHRSRPALGLGVSQRVPNEKLLEKKGPRRMGAAPPVTLTGSTKRRRSAVFELFQLEHVKSTKG